MVKVAGLPGATKSRASDLTALRHFEIRGGFRSRCPEDLWFLRLPAMSAGRERIVARTGHGFGEPPLADEARTFKYAIGG
jgi:hypothetical protein